METTYYTFTANEIVVAGDAVRQVSGGSRRLVCRRHQPMTPPPAAGGKVLDFDSFRARREAEEAAPSLEEDYEDFFPAEEPAQELAAPRRPRSSHRRAMTLDWMASVAVIAVALCACVSFFL